MGALWVLHAGGNGKSQFKSELFIILKYLTRFLCVNALIEKTTMKQKKKKIIKLTLEFLSEFKELYQENHSVK